MEATNGTIVTQATAPAEPPAVDRNENRRARDRQRALLECQKELIRLGERLASLGRRLGRDDVYWMGFVLICLSNIAEGGDDVSVYDVKAIHRVAEMASYRLYGKRRAAE